MKVNDSRLYLYFTIITLVITLILGAISYYSILIVEPKVEKLLSANDSISESYRQAYGLLRDPQIFARYENFDQDSKWIKDNIIPYMDNKAYYSIDFTPDEKLQLDTLLNRRKQGSVLGRNSMIFFFLLSLMGLGFLIFEKIKTKE
jgi:hypothetical protein